MKKAIQKFFGGITITWPKLITLLTFPAGFIAWYIKKDKWYSGIIISLGTIFLTVTAVAYIYQFIENPPNHLLSIIYCIAFSLVMLFGFLKDKTGMEAIRIGGDSWKKVIYSTVDGWIKEYSKKTKGEYDE